LWEKVGRSNRRRDSRLQVRRERDEAIRAFLNKRKPVYIRRSSGDRI